MPVPTSHTSWHFMSSSVYQALCEPWTDSLAGPLQQPYQVALNSSPQVAAQGPEAQSVVACASLPTRQHNHVLPPSKFGHFPTTCANLGQQPSFLFVPALPGLGGALYCYRSGQTALTQVVPGGICSLPGRPLRAPTTRAYSPDAEVEREPDGRELGGATPSTVSCACLKMHPKGQGF